MPYGPKIPGFSLTLGSWSGDLGVAGAGTRLQNVTYTNGSKVRAVFVYAECPAVATNYAKLACAVEGATKAVSTVGGHASTIVTASIFMLIAPGEDYLFNTLGVNDDIAGWFEADFG